MNRFLPVVALLAFLIFGVFAGVELAPRSARAGVSERRGIISSGVKASTSTTPVVLFAANANDQPTRLAGLTAYNTDTVVHVLTITDSSGAVLRAKQIPAATSTTAYGETNITELDNVSSSGATGISFFVDAAGVTTSVHVSAQAFQN